MSDDTATVERLEQLAADDEQHIRNWHGRALIASPEGSERAKQTYRDRAAALRELISARALIEQQARTIAELRGLVEQAEDSKRDALLGLSASADRAMQEYRDKIAQQAARLEAMTELLKVAKCPDTGCNGQGFSVDVDNYGQPVQVQCQFCYEQRAAIDGAKT